MQKKSKKILVTGASGQLGRKLTRRLIESGYDVVAHFRSQEKADQWLPDGVDPVFGDLLLPEWLYAACQGCDTVIHCAAWVSLGPRNYDMMYQINVVGTRAVVDACRKAGVRRLIHISSVGAIGVSSDKKILDESAEFNLDKFGIPYFETKRLAEKEALNGNGDDLEVIVLNPSIMISPADRKVSETDLAKIPKKLPFYFDFGLNFVHSEDVVSAILNSIDSGSLGNRYILAGENISAKRAFKLAEKYIGLKKPFLKLPYLALYSFSAILELMRKVKIPVKVRVNGWDLNRKIARLTHHNFFYNSSKAIKEIGFISRPLDQSIKEILASIK